MMPAGPIRTGPCSGRMPLETRPMSFLRSSLHGSSTSGRSDEGSLIFQRMCDGRWIPSIRRPRRLSHPLDLTRIIDDDSLTVRYAAAAGEVSDEDNTYAISPSKFPGQRRHSIDSASSRKWKCDSVAASRLRPATFRVEHDPLPDDVRLVFRVRDQNGKLLNKGLPIDCRLYSDFCLVVFEPRRAYTLTVQLEICVSRSLHFEFLVEPPVDSVLAEKPKGRAAVSREKSLRSRT